jgi:hypothetical protein
LVQGRAALGHDQQPLRLSSRGKGLLHRSPAGDDLLVLTQDLGSGGARRASRWITLRTGSLTAAVALPWLVRRPRPSGAPVTLDTPLIPTLLSFGPGLRPFARAPEPVCSAIALGSAVACVMAGGAGLAAVRLAGLATLATSGRSAGLATVRFAGLAAVR